MGTIAETIVDALYMVALVNPVSKIYVLSTVSSAEREESEIGAGTCFQEV